MKTKILLAILLTVFLTFGVFGCDDAPAGENDVPDETTDDENGEVVEGPPIVVSSKIFTESIILGEMLIELLEYHGYETGNEVGLGSTNIIRPALISGDVDIYYEYTGTVLMTQMEHEAIFEAEEAYQTVKEWDLETNDIVWLEKAPANNTDIMLARPGLADELGVSTISELVEVIDEGLDTKLTFAVRDEWYERADGFGRFTDIYELDEDKIDITFIGMGLEYDALRTEEVDISFGFATDGRIAAFDLDVIEDDQNSFAVYNPAPTIRKDTLDTYPELEEIINEVTVLLTNEQLRELTQAVDVDGGSTDEVARNFLLENGFIE
ncbi:MAG: glycine betaine ABC transporter substrate-binding protein [Bacillota bacterium]